MNLNNQKSTTDKAARSSTYLHRYHLIIALMLVLLLLGVGFGQGYVEGVNIGYDHMPMKIKMPTGDQKFTGSNFKIATSIPIFLTPNKSSI